MTSVTDTPGNGSSPLPGSMIKSIYGDDRAVAITKIQHNVEQLQAKRAKVQYSSLSDEAKALETDHLNTLINDYKIMLEDLAAKT